MLEGPDDRVEDQLELRGGDGEKAGEAVVVHRLQHQEEVCSMFRELFEILKKFFNDLKVFVTTRQAIKEILVNCINEYFWQIVFKIN